jgi:hypothetical protein
LFWKKQTAERQPFNLDNDDQRAYFRVSPPEPPTLWLDGRPATLVDIGAGGLAVVNRGWTEGALLTVRLRLPSPAVEITAALRIIGVDAGNVCHGAFADIDDAGVEAIHRYVLEIQKQSIRAERRGKTAPAEQR